MRYSIRLLCVTLAGFALSGPAVLLAQNQDSSSFSLSGDTRVRYESLDGQFRQGLTGSDQVLAMRSLLRADVETEAFAFTGEVQDSRTYLDDEGTPLSGSLVNTMELIQASVSWRQTMVGSDFMQGWEAKLGRFTLDIGSRRFVERNDFRNTTNAYSGLHWTGRFAGAATLDAFFVAPMEKLPAGRSLLDDNRIEADAELDSRRFWGVHYQRPRTFGDVQLDLLVYGLRENDGAIATLDRALYAPGFRLLKNAVAGGWDFELEAAFRYGKQSASLAADAHSLDVRAHMLHAEFGFTFASSWNPRLSLEYDLATGDDVATPDFERYERFYGTRRGDLGNTSIHGPLTRSNISVLGLRYGFSHGATDGRVVLQQALLAEASDAWIAAPRMDPTGQSGRELGQTLDFRIRHWLLPERVRAEVGGSALLFGDFPDKVPGGPEADRTLYGYGQVTLNF